VPLNRSAEMALSEWIVHLMVLTCLAAAAALILSGAI
jgi:hypothetical protein